MDFHVGNRTGCFLTGTLDLRGHRPLPIVENLCYVDYFRICGKKRAPLKVDPLVSVINGKELLLRII